jgi:hypothetical protein
MSTLYHPHMIFIHARRLIFPSLSSQSSQILCLPTAGLVPGANVYRQLGCCVILTFR